MASDLTELPLQHSRGSTSSTGEITLVTRTPKVALLGGAFVFDEPIENPLLITLYLAVQRRPHATIETSAWAVFSQAM